MNYCSSYDLPFADYVSLRDFHYPIVHKVIRNDAAIEVNGIGDYDFADVFWLIVLGI
jgi:hypothetical protein